MPPQILYEDNHLLVANKPNGLLVQGDRSGETTLLEQSKTYLKKKYNKPGNVFLGLTHRLDKPVSGVIVFARTSKAAARLSEQIRQRTVKKNYWALVEGHLPKQGIWEDYIARKGYGSRLVDAKKGQLAVLAYKRMSTTDALSLVHIELQTGRHHQIRVQFAHRGYPVLGDARYGSSTSPGKAKMALHARSFEIKHPVTKKSLRFLAEPPSFWGDIVRINTHSSGAYISA